MDIKMGYRNKHESADTWHLLANSTEKRTLNCDINGTHHDHHSSDVRTKC